MKSYNLGSHTLQICLVVCLSCVSWIVEAEDYYQAPDPRVHFTPDFPTSDNFPQKPWVFAGRNLREDRTLLGLFEQASIEEMRKTVSHLVTYNNRYYHSATGRSSVLWYAEEFRRMAREAKRTDVDVILQEHASSDARRLQPTLVVRLKGQGDLAKEIIVVGTPADCINSETGMGSVDDPCPGADDNASGMAVVLESFRVLLKKGIKPLRTLQFVAYAGEELGLIGSHYVAESHVVNGEKVVGVLQLEGTMYPGAQPKIALVSDYTHSEVTEFLKRIIEKHLDVPYALSPCGYGCSDHAAWRKRGFPVAFPYSETIGHDNPQSHTVRDTIDRLSFVHGMRFTRITLSFLIELSLSP